LLRHSPELRGLNLCGALLILQPQNHRHCLLRRRGSRCPLRLEVRTRRIGLYSLRLDQFSQRHYVELLLLIANLPLVFALHLRPIFGTRIGSLSGAIAALPDGGTRPGPARFFQRPGLCFKNFPRNSVEAETDFGYASGSADESNGALGVPAEAPNLEPKGEHQKEA